MNHEAFIALAVGLAGVVITMLAIREGSDAGLVIGGMTTGWCIVFLWNTPIQRTK